MTRVQDVISVMNEELLGSQAAHSTGQGGNDTWVCSE